MKIANLKPFKVIAQAVVAGLLLMACENNSSGSKDTTQMDNDDDPTNIENQTGQDIDNRTTMGTDRNVGSMDNTGANSDNLDRNNTGANTGVSGNMDSSDDIVVIQNFDDQKWQKFRTDRNFQSGENISFNDINTSNMGADSWKTYQNKQYRIVYYTDNGSLKARPIVRTDDNTEIQLTTQTARSMSLQGLWDEIQKEVSGLKDRY
jgi:hypothetical protein